jgi:small conductance mechanosensitive channel
MENGTQELLQDPTLIVDHVTTITQILIEKIIEFWPRVLLAVIVWMIWVKLIKFLWNMVDKLLDASKIDWWLKTFLWNLLHFGLKILLVLSILSTIGVETTSFIAVVWATWLAIWLALQWSLSNFAWWVMILLFRPFKIWQFIETQWIMGTVQAINIFNTSLLTPESRTTIVPNWSIINNTIKNFSENPIARIDISVGISYSANIAHAKQVLTELIEHHPDVRMDPWSWVFVNNLGDSAVEMLVRCYCDGPVFILTKFDLTEKVKLTLDEHGIEIPFPQRVVHMKTA